MIAAFSHERKHWTYVYIIILIHFLCVQAKNNLLFAAKLVIVSIKICQHFHEIRPIFTFLVKGFSLYQQTKQKSTK
jgi:hypothetical protein